MMAYSVFKIQNFLISSSLCSTVQCALCTVYCVHQVVEFGAGEGENKEKEKGKKDPVLEAQQIAKRILGYNSSDPGRLQCVFPLE
jgi:hypothetical protein